MLQFVEAQKLESLVGPTFLDCQGIVGHQQGGIILGACEIGGCVILLNEVDRGSVL